MTAWLMSLLERLPRPVRRGVVAVVALLLLGAVMASLTLTSPPQGGGPQRTSSSQAPATERPAHAAPQRLPLPVYGAELFRARAVAEQFLAGYLPFAYGRANAGAVGGATAALRRRLLGEQAQVTPAERRRRPSVVSLQTVGTTPGFVVATAVVDDGGITTYRLRFTLQRRAGRWAVSSVEG